MLRTGASFVSGACALGVGGRCSASGRIFRRRGSQGACAPALTNAEMVQLQVWVIAFENLVIALLAESSEAQRDWPARWRHTYPLGRASPGIGSPFPRRRRCCTWWRSVPGSSMPRFVGRTISVSAVSPRWAVDEKQCNYGGARPAGHLPYAGPFGYEGSSTPGFTINNKCRTIAFASSLSPTKTLPAPSLSSSSASATL